MAEHESITVQQETSGQEVYEQVADREVLKGDQVIQLTRGKLDRIVRLWEIQRVAYQDESEQRINEELRANYAGGDEPMFIRSSSCSTRGHGPATERTRSSGDDSTGLGLVCLAPIVDGALMRLWHDGCWATVPTTTTLMATTSLVTDLVGEIFHATASPTNTAIRLGILSETRKLNKLWHPWEREKVDYFVLGDLWNSFGEWSAYGAGVPILGQTLIQYFVPYLSAIQIFTSSSSVNCLRYENECVSETRDSFSDSFSEESECEKLWRWDGCSSEEGIIEQDSFWLPNERLGNLYLQYFEQSSPYGRVPLTDKISSLAERYPGLMSLRSVDLSPASWMAVAWYPIYHIPTGTTMKDLQTCFLSYHTLSSSFQDMEQGSEKKEGESNYISLPPFGLATYKMQGDVWISDKKGHDGEKIMSLLSVADSWLKQLRVEHHDFNYFTGIRHV
ncbi:hypothetical protein STAS_01948 [Striga asiatica]|uniref:Uncharacterized protein n=1 Tax=Striga asiatica TaxID=4170 RepID=A0A5A7P1F2_STRAF|nr:hypothetical protein STAS_01948 [Striga asiatica]